MTHGIRSRDPARLLGGAYAEAAANLRGFYSFVAPDPRTASSNCSGIARRIGSCDGAGSRQLDNHRSNRPLPPEVFVVVFNRISTSRNLLPAKTSRIGISIMEIIFAVEAASGLVLSEAIKSSDDLRRSWGPLV